MTGEGSPLPLNILLWMSVATMVIGLVAALNERDFRRILSFNLVSHIGYTTACLSLLSPAALAAGIFYVLHHIVVITNLFLVSGVFLRLRRTTGEQGELQHHGLVLGRTALGRGLAAVWRACRSARPATERPSTGRVSTSGPPSRCASSSRRRAGRSAVARCRPAGPRRRARVRDASRRHALPGRPARRAAVASSGDGWR